MAIELQHLIGTITHREENTHVQVGLKISQVFDPPKLGREPSIVPLEDYVDYVLCMDPKAHQKQLGGHTFKAYLPDNTIVTVDVCRELARRFKSKGWVTCAHQVGEEGNPNASFFWMS